MEKEKQKIIDYIDQLRKEAELDDEMIGVCFWNGTNTIKEMVRQLGGNDD